MTEPVFTGPFKTEMQDFISLKRSVGYKYSSEPGILGRFDNYLALHYPEADMLSKEAVTGWCRKTMHETAANQCSRASVIRQFSKYMDSIGINAWILPKNYYPAGQKYVPHIYTPDELRRFFAETDKCHYCSSVPYRHLVMPEFFRLLLSCGLRCSEARLLTVGDVDLNQGVLTIRDSKNHNSRLVPMPESMKLRLRTYAEQVHPFPEPDRYFFPGYDGKPMTIGNIYKNFRRFLWKAGISHTGDGPRVHDFRHAYCIYRLKEWAEQDRDLMVLIPMMRTYLGHQTFNETAYYLRWTADIFPDIRMKSAIQTSFRKWRYSPMKPTDFSMHLTSFLSDYLPVQKNVSRNTIKSYRDTFKLLILFCEKEEAIPVEKLTMKKLSSERIERFLNWLETERRSSISTRNLRLTAIHSFFRYAQSESPESLYYYQKVLAIPVKKKRQPVVEHLSPEGIKVLLEQPDRSTAQGRRDLTLMSLMYDSGARVQEMIDLTVKDFIAGNNPVLILTGKGNKTRRVPIMKNTAALVEKYISENRLDLAHKTSYPLFTNKQHNKLTKEGVSYIINKYAVMAHESSDKVPEKVRCHMLRHSKAVHLLQAGVNLIYIRDFLGHSDIKTTEIYARADAELKRKALENAYPDLVDSNLPDWSENSDLMEWLSEL